MIYNINIGVGWASSGVEYAQIYRLKAFRKAKIDSKFIFFEDYFPQDYIGTLTKNIGFKDSDVIWVYQWFTDFDIVPVSFNLKNLEDTFSQKIVNVAREDLLVRYLLEDGSLVIAKLVDKNQDFVYRADLIYNGVLIKKDYYSSKKFLTELYSPKNNQACLYERIFYNIDGSVAYNEFVSGQKHIFVIGSNIFYSKQELYSYFIKQLNLNEKDSVIVDRCSHLAQPIFENSNGAKIFTIVHADHYSLAQSNTNNILWNNFYEYEFEHYEHVYCYIVSTEQQAKTLKSHFKKYKNATPKIEVIPVGNLDSLKEPNESRKKYSLITASRFASEKHIDFIVEAVVKSKAKLKDLSLYIYGTGAEKEKIENLIKEKGAQNYIKLKGHCDMTDIYANYQVYISASQSEGFGLSLMEACGSGLPLIGFKVPYGNTTFIKKGNGVMVDLDFNTKKSINNLSNAILKVFDRDYKSMSKASYEIASNYLVENVAKRWKNVLEV